MFGKKGNAVMAYQYGYGILEDELIDLFRSGAPDFDKAEDLIRQGVNINAIGSADHDNILSEILTGYWKTERSGLFSEQCDDCELDDCSDCEHNKVVNPNVGQSMCDIIHFFLEHGFDLNAYEGRVGARCLHALAFSSLDRYTLVGTKMLLDAGAVIRPISQNADNENEMPWKIFAWEESYQRTCANDYALENMYEAVLQVYEAVEDERPYDGIDTYEAAVGKRIIKVLALETDGEAFYSLDLPNYTKNNCFNCKLVFMFEDSNLVITQSGNIWVDKIMPNTDATDVSEYFEDLVGNTIRAIEFDHKTVAKRTARYGQPIIRILMDTGIEISFSTNFGGEVSKENYATFFKICRINEL